MDQGAKFDTITYREPMKIPDERRRVCALGLLENKPSTPILQLLKSVKVSLVNAVKN